jgi:hypothetical protein
LESASKALSPQMITGPSHSSRDLWVNQGNLSYLCLA